MAALACLCGALACTGASNKNPPLPPTGNGGSGFGGAGGQPPPSGNVIIEIQEPMDGLVALTGSLIDVRVHAFIDQGTDFIDPTSVQATVTEEGDTAELDSTKLAPQAMDLFTGRVSVGDRPTGNYVLTVRAISSSGARSSVSIAFQIDAGPFLSVRSPVALHAYKGLLIVEVVADAGPFQPLDGPHATVANYPGRARTGRRSGEQPVPRHDRSARSDAADDPAAARRWAAADGLGDERERQARGATPGVLHRRGGTDNHDDVPGAGRDRRRHHAHLGLGARPVGCARCLGDRRHRRRHAPRAVQRPAQARRRRRLQRPVRHAQADRMRGSAQLCRTVHRLPDDFVPRLGRAR